MKKNRLLLLALLGFFVTGCVNTDPDTDTSDSGSSSEVSSEVSSESESSASSEDTSSSEEETATILDYFPFEENVYYSYQGEGNEFAPYDTYPQYIDGNRMQLVEINPGTTSVKVVEYTDGKLVENFRSGQVYYRENMLDKTNENGGRIILQEPLEVGTTWESPNGNVAEITAVDVEVDTPLGVFPALEVTETAETSVNKYYYAKDIGLVKSEYTDDTGVVLVTTTLQARNQDMPEAVTMRVFYPDANVMGLESSDVNISFFTNDITRLTVTDLFKQIPGVEYGRLIPDNATINSLYLNDDGRVYIDFSEALVTDMNAGSSGESLILQGIVNTIGFYYGAQEVVLTVEGAPYESGHYSMQEGEAWTVEIE